MDDNIILSFNEIIELWYSDVPYSAIADTSFYLIFSSNNYPNLSWYNIEIKTLIGYYCNVSLYTQINWGINIWIFYNSLYNSSKAINNSVFFEFRLPTVLNNNVVLIANNNLCANVLLLQSIK